MVVIVRSNVKTHLREPLSVNAIAGDLNHNDGGRIVVVPSAPPHIHASHNISLSHTPSFSASSSSYSSVDPPIYEEIDIPCDEWKKCETPLAVNPIFAHPLRLTGPFILASAPPLSPSSSFYVAQNQFLTSLTSSMTSASSYFLPTSSNFCSHSSLLRAASATPSIAPPIIVGRNAARFEIKSIKIRCKRPTGRKCFNPLVLTRRGCTDICCCMIFAVFLAGWAAVAFLAFMWGKPERLIHPTDSLGRICGHNRVGAYNFSSRPYLLFFDLTKCISYTTVLTGCPTPQVCVEKCPTTYFSYLQLQGGLTPADFRLQIRSKIVCDDSVDKNRIESFEELKAFVDRGWCAAYTVNSAAVLWRCMPQILLESESGTAFLQTTNNQLQPQNVTLNALINVFGDAGGSVPNDQKISNSTYLVGGMLNSRAVIQKIAADLSVCWWQILALLVVSAVLSFLWTVVLRIFGGLMIYVSIGLLLILLATGSAFCWYRYMMLYRMGAINDYSFQPTINVYFEMPTTWMIFAIGLSILFIVVFVVALFVRSRIRLSVALIEESSSALGHMLSTLFFPLFPFILHVFVFAIWSSITIWLASSGEENCRRTNAVNPNELGNGEPCDCKLLGTTQEPNCRYVNLTRDNDRVLILQIYNLFGCFWLTCFISALSDMTIAGAFASHYFAFRKPRDVPSFPILRSLGRALRYHIGTLAFGALVLSVIRFLRAILDFVYDKLKTADNAVAKFLYRLMSCFFWCLEAFLRFLTRNAYIMSAIYGKGFCKSARDSFGLLSRNIVRVVVLNRITAFLLFIGKAMITCGLGAVSFYFFTGRWVIDGLPHIDLHYYFVPVIIVLVGSYFISDLFFNVYDMGVDTTFLCFLEDTETNDGSVEKPFYMSDRLKNILGKTNNF